MNNGKNVFDNLAKNDIRTYDEIRKIATVEEDDYTTSCVSWNKCQSKLNNGKAIPVIRLFILSTFSWCKQAIVLSFEDNAVRIRHTRYFI